MAPLSTATSVAISLPAIVIAFWITTTHFAQPTTLFGFIGAGIVVYLLFLVFCLIIGVPMYLLSEQINK